MTKRSSPLPFRAYHLLALLDEYQKKQIPIDILVSNYFRQHKALGSKDRLFIAETTYTLIRWKKLLGALSDQSDWPTLYKTFLRIDMEKMSHDISFPPAVRLSFPRFLYDRFVTQYGQERAEALCRISNTEAPITIRANSLKTSREELLKRLRDRYSVRLTEKSPDGIIFEKRIPFTTLPEFQEGLFEAQDEGSQLLAQSVQAHPGDNVLDYCAGSGGKTLAFAPRMQGKGQIYLHDIRLRILQEAKKRLRRAGVQNAQILEPGGEKHKALKKKMDWVLVDAPCSGTGTLRRNPDMKWKLSEEMITRLVGEQRKIFEKALSYVKPGGNIVYGTCSLLEEENEKQCEHFCQTYSLTTVGEPLRLFPEEGGMDGFFGVVFVKSLYTEKE